MITLRINGPPRPAMAHCGECHTPRNVGQGLDNRRRFTGTVQAGWRAHNISADQHQRSDRA